MHGLGEAAIGFGSSVIGTGAGKAISNKLESKGVDMMFRGARKIGCFTKAQARNLVKNGRVLRNTARGITSVVGTLFTWPTAKSLSDCISK